MRQVVRQEKKFLINAETALQLRARLAPVLHADDHNGPRGYMVRSLYFDTVHERDYVEKLFGANPRRKVRLRVYDPHGDFALLELKQKDGENQLKRSLAVNRAEAKRLISGDLGWMLGRPEPFAQELFAIMQMHGYRPKAVIEYRRQAYVARENRIRITFDSDIRATEAHMDAFDPHLLMHPVFDPFNTVLEVKYNGFLLSYIKDQLNAVSKRPLSVSKYCLGRDITQGFQF